MWNSSAGKNPEMTMCDRQRSVVTSFAAIQHSFLYMGLAN